MTPALTQQRCLHHGTREAVARCLECRQFFCRECIAEHDDRVVCASCLKKLARATEKKPRRPWPLWPAAQLASGFFFTWLLFYIVGRLLLSMPDDFHDATLWKGGLLNAIGFPDDE